MILAVGFHIWPLSSEEVLFYLEFVELLLLLFNHEGCWIMSDGFLSIPLDIQKQRAVFFITLTWHGVSWEGRGLGED